MGLAVRGNRLAIGLAMEICEYHNLPAVARKVKPEGKHDACFLPRSAYATGDIQIHEMAWVGNGLWFVNTAFSCLCTRSDGYSFRPRWRPPFVSHLVPEDRCHLNGLGLVEGQVRYVAPWERRTRPAAGGRTNATAAFSSTCPRTRSSPAAYACPIRPAGMMAGFGFWSRAQAHRHHRSGLGPLSAAGRVAGLYPRLVVPRAAGLCGPVAGPRVGRFQRHSAGGAAPGAESCGVWVVNILRAKRWPL